jgi:hypothetical protein
MLTVVCSFVLQHQAVFGRSGPPRLAFPNPTGSSPLNEFGMRTSYGCLTGPFTTGVLANGSASTLPSCATHLKPCTDSTLSFLSRHRRGLHGRSDRGQPPGFLRRHAHRRVYRRCHPRSDRARRVVVLNPLPLPIVSPKTLARRRSSNSKTAIPSRTFPPAPPPFLPDYRSLILPSNPVPECPYLLLYPCSACPIAAVARWSGCCGAGQSRDYLIGSEANRLSSAVRA